MRFVSRATILFIVAALGPSIFIFLELFRFMPPVSDWISYPFLIVSMVALVAAVYEVYVGYKVTDADDLKNDE